MLMSTIVRVLSCAGALLLLLIVIKITTLILQDFATQRKFDEFIVHFNKSYSRHSSRDNGLDSSVEFFRRFRIFEDALRNIEQLNAHRTLRTDGAARYGITQFADLTHDEFRDTMLTKRRNQRVQRPRAVPISVLVQPRKPRAISELPAYVNWMDAGRVSPVRNQGSCGACWAHSVIETIESMVAIQYNMTAPVRSLSVQQMIDCAGTNHGCAGGDTCNLLQWLVLNDVPIAGERQYPLTGSQRPCSVQQAQLAIDPVRVRSFTCEQLVGHEDRMVEYLATTGPLTAAVNAIGWQYYVGGIIQHHCDGESMQRLNHAVQIVGYDRRGKVPYFIVRNSWGDNFGDRGLVRIEMGSNMCGIALQVSAIAVV